MARACAMSANTEAVFVRPSRAWEITSRAVPVIASPSSHQVQWTWTRSTFLSVNFLAIINQLDIPDQPCFVNNALVNKPFVIMCTLLLHAYDANQIIM